MFGWQEGYLSSPDPLSQGRRKGSLEPTGGRSIPGVSFCPCPVPPAVLHGSWHAVLCACSVCHPPTHGVSGHPARRPACRYLWAPRLLTQVQWWVRLLCCDCPVPMSFCACACRSWGGTGRWSEAERKQASVCGQGLGCSRVQFVSVSAIYESAVPHVTTGFVTLVGDCNLLGEKW